MRLLHPVMPFVTEEIWRSLPHAGESIVIASWPERQEHLEDPTAEEGMARIMDTIRAIRNVRAEMNVPLGRPAAVVVQTAEPTLRGLLEASSGYLAALASVDDLRVGPVTPAKPPRSAAAILPGLEVYLPLQGLIDLDREMERLSKALTGAQAELARSREKLANEQFISRAPADVVEREREKEAQSADTVVKLERRLGVLRER